MSTILEPETAQRHATESSVTDSATRVKTDFAACRVKFRWFGTSRTLSTAQKSQAAESFGAEGKAISAAKRLIDTKNSHYLAVTSIKSKIIRYWKESSLAYPEPGIRLIKQGRIDDFNDTLEAFRGELETAVGLLDEHFMDLKEAARLKLGQLYDSNDYPTSLTGEFAVVWDYPSVDAPDYLRRLNPEVYAQQASLVSQRFEETVALAEQAFIDELDQLVSHLAERLSGDDDGKPKVFRNSALTNMSAFFERFRELNVRSNQQLDDLVERCEQLVSGVAPQSLRDNDSLRASLSSNLATVQSSLDQLMVERPRRNIIRPTKQTRAGE